MSQSPQIDKTIAREVAELEMLAQDASPAAVRKLRIALKHPLPIIRQVAATALGRSGNPAAVRYLVSAARDPATEVRRSVMWALGQIGDSGAIDALQEALSDPDGDVRRAAVWALSRMEQGRTSAQLAAAQSDEDFLVRRSAGAVVAGANHRFEKTPQTAGMARHRRQRWPVILIGAVGALAVICAAAVRILWGQPLGPGLVALEGSPPDAEAVASAALVGEAAPQCGGPPVMKLLIIGLDSEGYDRGFADVIRVARIDFITPGVILLGVPRDLWVTIPGQEQYGINEDRIRYAYPYGNVNKVPGGGPSLLAQTLTFNLGLQVNRYVATDFATFEAAIDQIGGVDIYLSEDIGNAQTDPPYFSAGWTHMDGATALRFARVRPDNSSDLARMDRQNEVILAIRDKLTSSELLPQVPALVNQMQGSVATDLSPAEVSSLLCIVQKAPPEEMSFVRIDKPMILAVTDEFGYERLLPDQEALRSFVRAFDDGDLEALRKAAKP